MKINSNAMATILIVDDVAENLAVAHDALDGAGYRVRVATSGLAALESARLQPPDLILLDAMMPGVDGFETCRRFKADLATRPIPIVFMTGLTDTDHVVRGFQAGGIDYITKPIRPQEVIARIASHLRNARLVAETQAASDAAGDAIVSIDDVGRVSWATPLARSWLVGVCGVDHRLPEALLRWLAIGEGASPNFSLQGNGQRLAFSKLGERRLLVQRHEAVPEPDALMRLLPLTAREAEVLYWVALGKTNPEIAGVLEMSPRTVNKHLEHIFTKLGVETRTAAATVALNRSRLGVVPN
ncbi:response regulator transcription factor [uncultured Nevskia sp.]|uniref:response regulator transcription factor n=1 Tax=uncultured Nevskia sp. TaxID=228950 RepID=UPI0025EC7FDD|nr:response regulator transcription factor [uncultured Nevskia sp.]